MSAPAADAAAVALPSHTRKVCELFRLLAGHEVLGLAPGEIARGLDVLPSWVSRALPALAAETGFVERVGDTGRWRLGVPFVRIALTVSTNLSASRRQLDELAGRYGTPI